jgi:hypothetical protein
MKSSARRSPAARRQGSSRGRCSANRLTEPEHTRRERRRQRTRPRRAGARRQGAAQGAVAGHARQRPANDGSSSNADCFAASARQASRGRRARRSRPGAPTPQCVERLERQHADGDVAVRSDPLPSSVGENVENAAKRAACAPRRRAPTGSRAPRPRPRKDEPRCRHAQGVGDGAPPRQRGATRGCGKSPVPKRAGEARQVEGERRVEEQDA